MCISHQLYFYYYRGNRISDRYQIILESELSFKNKILCGFGQKPSAIRRLQLCPLISWLCMICLRSTTATKPLQRSDILWILCQVLICLFPYFCLMKPRLFHFQVSDKGQYGQMEKVKKVTSEVTLQLLLLCKACSVMHQLNTSCYHFFKTIIQSLR